MNTQGIKKLFDDFLLNYDVESKNGIWKAQSQKFRDFWNKKILSDRKEELNEGEVDEVIRIIDSSGKGNRKGCEAIARVMIPQGAWRRMYLQTTETT